MSRILNTCYLCNGNLKFKFSRFSEPLQREFDIYGCQYCKNWQIYPLPDQNILNDLYESKYFSKRTSRGYNDYAGEQVKKSVLSTLNKNLNDLNFFSWESRLVEKKSLEIGAASGHFVEFLQLRGWNAAGIDISKSMTDAGKKIGLNMIYGDFLAYEFNQGKHGKFDLVSLWATLEHLPNPDKYINKICRLLKPDGHLYLSTTNTGFWARIYGPRWRYLNVPEHIYYFNKKSLGYLFKKYGLKINSAFTYGSGFTARENSSLGYRLLKNIFDRSARYFFSGDMIVLDIVFQHSGNSINTGDIA